MPLPPSDADSTAVVTGASSGIGAEIARELARRGHGVTLVARSEVQLRDLAAELSSGGSRAEVIAADLCDRAARAALPDRIAALGLRADILVNNAGMSTLGPVARADPRAETAMLELDVVAVADLCSRFLPAMVAAGRGAVLNVGSLGAFQPLPGQAGYGAAKAFVVSYTASLAGELRGTGVTATVLCPGPVDTGFGERAGFTPEDAQKALPKMMWLPPEAVARIGVDGLARGRLVVIPGMANRAAARVSRLVPDRMLTRLVARQHPGLR